MISTLYLSEEAGSAYNSPSDEKDLTQGQLLTKVARQLASLIAKSSFTPKKDSRVREMLRVGWSTMVE